MQISSQQIPKPGVALGTCQRESPVSLGGTQSGLSPFSPTLCRNFSPASLSHICYMRAAEQKFLVDATSVSLWISLWSLTNNHRWYL